MSFSSVLIGRGPLLIAGAEKLLARGHTIENIVSDCGEVTVWAQKRGLSRLATSEDVEGTLATKQFDYLFSIVNHSLTNSALLSMPKLGAINFHDSLLPAYGGFNATSWAILDGRIEHGITWHRMAVEADSGAILLQKRVSISPEDTAASLELKAGDLGARSFEELLLGLENGDLSETPGRPAENFHRKSERPGLAVIDPSGNIEDALRLIRAFDLGSSESWLCRSKLVTPSGDFVVVGSAQPGAGSGSPATLQRADDGQLEVSFADGSLVLSGVNSLEGEELNTADLSRLGLVAGVTLPVVSEETSQTASDLDAFITGKERYWVKRLERQEPPILGELRFSKHAAYSEMRTTSAALGEQTCSIPPEHRTAHLLAALAVYMKRVGQDISRVWLGLVADDLSEELTHLYASVVPLELDVEDDQTISSILEHTESEYRSAQERKTFARDVWSRYASLRKRSIDSHWLPIAVDLSVGRRSELPRGVRLVVGLDSEASRVELRYDTRSMAPVAAQRLVQRLAHVMEGVATGFRDLTTVDTLSIVTPEERQLLLENFQDTNRPDVNLTTISELFDEQVVRTPNKTAVVFRDESLTYRQLNERAMVLASELQHRGVGPDVLVAVAVERSLHMVVSLLGVLKAGGAYVPLDPAYPSERLSVMLEDSGARLLVTQAHLEGELPRHDAETILIDRMPSSGADKVETTASAEHLAYVIFTSGSTGRPKGVMVEHSNVSNFFAGIDDRVGTEPGVWLAVTSISFDISILELLWTLTRGFEVIVQEEGDRASLLKSQSKVKASIQPMGFGLFYFAADSSDAPQVDAYRILLEGARFADAHDFDAIWTPERHFHAFGGLYPNPAVTSAAIAAVTQRLEIRAGSVVLPLHDPIRVAEEWAVVDNLSGGRVGLSFASGWHANDFALQPDNYDSRREIMSESINTVLRLWAGESITRKNGNGDDIEVSVLPRPRREQPPMWIASAGNVATFEEAGRSGYNILTNMLGQDLENLRGKFIAYRKARAEAGHDGPGTISVMLHTFVADDDEKARELARRPFGNYLKSSYDLVKVAPWMFPAFKQPSVSAAEGETSAFDPERFDDKDMDALLDHAFDRYFDTAGLFGTPERALRMVENLKMIGATEVACLIDFGIDPDIVLENLTHLDALRRLSNPSGAEIPVEVSVPVSIAEQFERRSGDRRITHFQCTPSMARMLSKDGTLDRMGGLECFLVGGEALPVDLVDTMIKALPATRFVNMYGPTETTIWSSTKEVRSGEEVTIGKPIANTQIRILDASLGLLPLGATGELCIGGTSVVRGYFEREDLTKERFVADPYLEGNRLYRTGDLARFRDNGELEYIGRIDQQVKFSGYRIELGEIETVLSKHPVVKEAVVAVKNGPVGPQLVGYVIPAGKNDSVRSDVTGQVTDWEKRWDEAYSKRIGATDAPARFDTSGWLDSFTGAPTDTEKMREWLDLTTSRILELRPQHVLEIGCGTGMVLYSCLPHVEHYTAVDVSPHALETIRTELRLEEREKVTLFRAAAHELPEFEAGQFDLVIINSVVQYFPDADYLRDVLDKAARATRDGGHIFLGDVRSLEEARLFHTRVELEKSPGSVKDRELSKRIDERAEAETELLLSQAFFGQIEREVERLSLGSIQLKKGRLQSEMRDFRSDVVLEVGSARDCIDLSSVETIRVEPGTDIIALLREHAVGEQSPILLTGILNSRQSGARVANEKIDEISGAIADDLRSLLNSTESGIDPDVLFELDGFNVELRFGSRLGTFDALASRSTALKERWVAPEAAGSTTSTPHARPAEDVLFHRLVAHVKEFLPAYMVPQSFVTLDTFPLTPNGKIDRNALPLPSAGSGKAASEFAVPTNDLEKSIASIWREILGLERVGRKDNIFDLGASSLITVEANNRLQSMLGTKIPLVSMFRYPTIETLAGHLGESLKGISVPQATKQAVAAEVQMGRQSRMAAAAERRRRARSQN